MDFPTLLGHSSKEAQLANWKNPEHLVTNWLPASPQSATTGHRRLAPTTCRSTLLPLPPLAPTFAFPLFCCSAYLACTSRTTALLCCTPNLTKPPPSLSSGGNKGMESCADATICVLGISVHTPAGDGWRPLSPRHRAGQGRACDWRRSGSALAGHLPHPQGSQLLKIAITQFEAR